MRESESDHAWKQGGAVNGGAGGPECGAEEAE
jgi:hypothetical protein